MGRPTSAAGRGEPPAASLDDAVGVPATGLGQERAGELLRRLVYLVQPRRNAMRPLKGQEAVGQKAERGMVVEARPGTSFEVIQPQLFLELLVALLDLPTRFPQPDSLFPRGRRGQAAQP